MIKFPSITQFRNVINAVKHKASFMGLDESGTPIYNKHTKLPELLFQGNVKLHGTNASIVQMTEDSPLKYQSRENELDTHNDNAGFCNAMLEHEKVLIGMFDDIRQHMSIKHEVPVTIYGEWCGGNIQKGVAINGLDKMFVVFAIRVDEGDDTQWIRPSHSQFNYLINYGKPLYNINEFGSYVIKVDFEHPEIAQNYFVQETLKVEDECPAGKVFGILGIGEGLVWHCVDMPSSDFVFKTKGEKHSASKVKTIAAVDVEKIAAIKELVDTILTENRMIQMVEGIDRDSKNTGEFISKCMKDCIKEELDTIEKNGFTKKEFTHAAMSKARRWFLS